MSNLNTSISNLTPEVIGKSGRPIKKTKAFAVSFVKQHQQVTQKVESLECSE